MVTLEWLGTAGFRVSGDSAIFLIDPYLSRNRNALPCQSRKPADLRGDAPIFLSLTDTSTISWTWPRS